MNIEGDTIDKSSGHVLIIDDEPVVFDCLEVALRADFGVLGASNGADGIAIARMKQPDLIVLDIKLPDINGFELCRVLQEEPETQHIPIIFMTALESSEDEVRGLEAGAVDYITKPIKPAVVRARVGTHMELKKHRDRLQSLTVRDGLTGIPNRRAFDEALDREWRRAMRAGSCLSLILMDIDFFKRYNDSYGHVAGDECLRAIAAALDDATHRGGDFVGRYGGEEFVAILPETPFEAAKMMAERYRSCVEHLRIPHACSEVSEVLTLSVGAATAAPDYKADSESLVLTADRMLYKAKDLGRNGIAALSLAASRAGHGAKQAVA